MKKSYVRIGATYTVRISGKLAPVKIICESPLGGWHGRNTQTGRAVRIRTAGRLRTQIDPEPDDQDLSGGHYGYSDTPAAARRRSPLL